MDVGASSTDNGPMRLFMRFIAVTALAALAASALVNVSGEAPARAYLWLIFGPTLFVVAGVYLLWRKPNHRISWLLLGFGAAVFAFPAPIESVVKARHVEFGVESWTWAALVTNQVLVSIGIAALVMLIGLFPVGSARTRWEKRFVRAAWGTPVVQVLLLPVLRYVPVDGVTYPAHQQVEHPLFVEALAWSDAETIWYLYLTALFVASIALQIARYRSAPTQERKQIRWVLYASAAALLLTLPPFVLGELGVVPALTHGPLLSLTFIPILAIPASVVVAIDQPRWIDTDTVIRRSFAYGALSLTILVLYTALAATFGLAAGTRLPVEVAIVVTVAAAIAFQPARTRLQRVVDRWVYGDNPNPLAVVAGFDQTIQDIEGPAELAKRLAETVRRAVRLQWASVEIPPEPTATAGNTRGEPAVSVPIRHGDEQLGWIHCGPKTVGSLGDDDADLIATLAGQAGLATYNARLAARIVQAQEAERRRIERNIHDGAQQELVALVAKLGLARNQVRGGNLNEAMLIELQEATGAILRDLREFAQGIHPSVLTDGGLLEAVEDRCGRLPIQVAIQSSPCLRRERFDDDIEGAAYFFITEGIANVLKHSSASRATVSLRHVDDHLELSISDDGVGFDPRAVRRNGLAGLSDRIAALAGTISVETRSGEGTDLRARLPVEESHR